MTRRSALALLLLAACRPSGEAAQDRPRASAAAAGPADTAPWMQRPASAAAPGVFHPGRVQVGDTVAGMRIAELRVERAADGEPVGTVRFAGEARVRGRAGAHPDPDVDLPCFFADSASAHPLPRFPRDERRPWFCFSNAAEARRMLPADTVARSVVIDGFIYQYARTDVVNTARLVRVEPE